MKKVITPSNIDLFAYSNRKILKKPVKGVVVEFGGLGFSMMFSEETESGIFYAGHGILCVAPYHNPWAWMNAATARFTDDVLDTLTGMLGLPNDIPIASVGGSMGGQQALAFMFRTRRHPVTCAANCPVCDLVYHFGERPDLPRTIYSAYCDVEAETLDEALATGSPLHNVDRLPKDAGYIIYHCTEDREVGIDSHSRRLVSLMKEKGLDVYYEEVPDRGHVDLPDSIRLKARMQIIDSLTERKQIHEKRR